VLEKIFFMIQTFIHYIQNILIPFGAIGVFAASILEEIIAPIPSAFVLTAAGFFLIPNHAWTFAAMRDLLFIIAIPGALGVTIGSLLVYGISYWVGKPVLERWGKFLSISWHEVEKLERRFEKGYSDEITLFVVRAIPIIPSAIISAFCGLVRLPLKEYILFSFLGTIVRAFVLGAIGWQVGALYAQFAKLINQAEKGILVIVGILILTFTVYRNIRKKQRNEQ
jgi:membrane protein DedA with SNARE-associated domain